VEKGRIIVRAKYSLLNYWPKCWAFIHSLCYEAPCLKIAFVLLFM
jgi:hypothetical protein